MLGNGKIWYEQGLDNTQLKKDAQDTTKIFDKISKDGVDSGNKIDEAFSRAGKAMVAFFSIQQAQQFISHLISVRGEFQQLEIAFNTMLGSSERGQAMMAQAVDTAAKTPFDLTQVAQGYKQLLAYGIAADDVNESLIMLGDVASAVSAPLGDIVYLYGTLQASGRVTMMDIRQFAGRGIPIYEELSKVLGTTKDKVNEFASAGKISFEDVQKAFQNLTGEGGKFNNLMALQSKSLTGQMSNLKDKVDMMFNEIGKSSEGFLNGAIEMTSDLVGNYEKVGKSIAELVAIYGAYKAAIIVADLAVKGYTLSEQILLAKITLVDKAQKMLNASMLKNPYTLAAAALVGLVASVYLLATHTTEAEESQNRLNKAFSEFDVKANNEISRLNQLKGQLESSKKGSESYRDAKEAIIKQFGKYYSNLGDEIERTGTLANSYDNLTASIRNAAMARGYDAYMKNEQENSDKTTTEKYEKIQNALIDKMGDEEGSAVYAELRDTLVKGEKLSASLQATLDKVQKKGTLAARSNIDQWVKDIQKSYKNLEDFDTKAKKRFGVGGGAIELYKPKKDEVEKPTEKTSQEKNGSKSTEKTALEIEQENQKIRADEERNTLESNRRLEDMQYEHEQNKLNTEKDSYEKRYAQLDLDLRRKKNSIERSQQDELARLVEVERQKAEREKRSFNSKSVKLPESVTNMYSKLVTDAEADYQNQQMSMLDEVLAKYKDYEQQRADLVKKYADDRKVLEKSSTENSKRALKELSKDEQKTLMDFDAMVSGKVSILSKLFGDASKYTVQQLEDVKKQAEELLMFLNGGTYNQIQGALFGMSEKDFLENIKPEQLAKIKAAIAGLGKSAEKVQSPIKELRSGIKDLFDPKTAGDAQRLTDAVNRIAKAYGKLADAAQLVGETLTNIGELSGSDALKGIGSAISDVLSVGDDMMSGMQTGAAFGVAGAAVGATVGLIKGVTGIFANNKKAREELKKTIKENQDKEYFGQLEIEAVWRKKYEWAQKIGETTLHYLAREGEELEKQSKENADAQSELLAKLYETKYKAGEHFEKTGLFGWGKGKIVVDWESLAGKTWKEIEALATEGKLSEEGMKFYEALKSAKEEGADLEQMQLEYLEKLKEVYTGTSYDNLVSGIVDAFKSGKRSATDFADSFEDLMKGAIKSSLQLMADNKMRAWYETWATMGADGYTAEEIAQAKKDYITLLENLNADATALENATGVSLTDTQSQGAATQGSWETISSEQANGIDGRLTGIHMEIVKQTSSLSSISSNLLEMRDTALSSWGELVSIRKNTALIAETNDKLDKVIKNTSNL